MAIIKEEAVTLVREYQETNNLPQFLRKFSYDCAKFGMYGGTNRKSFTEEVISLMNKDIFSSV